MITFSFEFYAEHGRTPPQISVVDQDMPTLTLPEGISVFNIPSSGTNPLQLNFFSKTERDTLIDRNNNIVKDTSFRINKIWCDNILLERWFLTDAKYKPDYFLGYLSSVPDAPKVITSPYQFNFPGIIYWEWSGEFWDWYFDQKNKREVINFLDKDPDRVWKFRGSLDPCEDLVKKLKELLHI